MNNLLQLAGLKASVIRGILDRAAALRSAAAEDMLEPSLQGCQVALCFLENSTRTRLSFEAACYKLGARVHGIQAAGSSTQKGETLLDTARLLQAIGAGVIVVRARPVGAAQWLSMELDSAVINAGDGTHEHPTQGLLDLLTIRDHLGEIEGRTVAIVGDIKHSRVARSTSYGLRALGARVVLAGPRTLMDGGLGDVYGSIDEVLPVADAVMMLRIQRERMPLGLIGSEASYRARWGLTATRAERMRPGAIVLHPAPMNRGVEIDSEVADGPRSAIFGQMANGVAIRMAVLERAFGVNP